MATRAVSGVVATYFQKDSDEMRAKPVICWPAVPPAITVHSVAGGLQMHDGTTAAQ